MSIQIQTPKGQKEIQTPEQKYDLSILDQPDDVLNQFMAIFECDTPVQMYQTLANNDLLIPSVVPIVKHRKFAILANHDKSKLDEVATNNGTDFSSLTKSQIIVNLITNLMIVNELAPSLKFKPSLMEKVIDPPKKTDIPNIIKDLESDSKWEKIKPITIAHPVETTYPEDQIDLRRKFIYNKCKDTWYNENNNYLSPNQIKSMVQMYDAVFFGGLIESSLKRTHTYYKFDLSSAKTYAGAYKNKGNAQIISISWPMFKKLFPSGSETYTSNGIVCRDRLEALQITLEHELIHMLVRLSQHLPEKIQKYDKVYSSHGQLFKDLVHAYFGHTGVTHGFHVPNENRKTKVHFKVSDRVQFHDAKGNVSQGKVVKLNPKKARVELDTKQTWNVPYSLLSLVEEDKNEE